MCLHLYLSEGERAHFNIYQGAALNERQFTYYPIVGDSFQGRLNFAIYGML